MFYQYREIGEREGWKNCSRDACDAYQRDPHIDTRIVPGEIALCPVPALYDRGDCCCQNPCTRTRAGDLRAQLRDVFPIGPVNGMNERDPHGSYVRLVLTHGEVREERLLSFGAADALQAELAGLLAIRSAS